MYTLNKKKSLITFNRLNEHNVINAFVFKPFNFRKSILDKKEIDKNFKKLEKSINNKFKKIILPTQIHDDNIAIIDKNNLNDSFDNVDALITNVPNIGLAIGVADCQGIILYDNDKKVIANVHSGWHGTLKKIIIKVLDIMHDKYNCQKENIEAYICPSILKCCFEVKDDVKTLFLNEFNMDEYLINKDNHYFIDTLKINKDLMLNYGIKEKNIEIINICTKCHNDYLHSYRADGINCGDNVLIVALKGE